MERLQRISNQLTLTAPLEKLLNELWNQRQRLHHAMQPYLSNFSLRLIKKHYGEILKQVETTRLQLDRKPPKNTETEAEIHTTFRKTLEENMYEILPCIVGELSDELAEKLRQAGGLLGRGISNMSGRMGSYQCRPGFLQRLTPNVRTLHYLENQILQYNNERESTGSIWVLLYIFSAAFVQVFGKYITRPEMGLLLEILKDAFILQLISTIAQDQQAPNQSANSSPSDLTAKMISQLRQAFR